MSDQRLDEFFTIPDNELSRWCLAQQPCLNIQFIEDIRSYAQQQSFEGDLSSALHCLARAMILAEALADPFAVAVVWKGRATVYQHDDLFEQSLAATKNASKIYEMYGTLFEVAKARTIEVYVLGVLERVEEAIGLANWIRPLFKAEKFTLGEAVVTANLARVYMNNWRYEEALPELHRAYSLYQHLEQQGKSGRMLHDMGVVYEQLDQLDTAASHYEQAYPLLITAKDVHTLVKNQFNLAQLSIRQTKFSEALNYLAQARGDTANLATSEDSAYIDLYEAHIRWQLGERANSLALYQKALAQFRAIGGRTNQIETLIQLAQVLASESKGSDLHQAIDYLEQAENLLESLDMPLFLGYIRLQKGEFLYKQNQLSQASSLATFAKNIFTQNNLSLRQAHADALLADCHRLLDPMQAQSLYLSAIKVVGENTPVLSARCWHGLGRIASGTGDIHSAIESYEKAINALDKVRHTLHTHTHRAGFMEDKQSLFGELLAALHAQNGTSPEKLFKWVERFKGQSLMELLAAQPVGEQIDTQLKQLLEEREQLRSELDHFQSFVSLTNTQSVGVLSRQRTSIQQYDQQHLTKVQATKSQLQRVDEQIAQRQSVAHQWREGSIDTPDIHQLLDKDTILISYYPAQGNLYALLATQTPGDIQTYALNTNLREINRLWQQTSRWVTRPKQDLQQAQSRLAQLWQILMAPINPQILRKKRLLILPHRDLYQIPFAALYDKAKNRYLIERWQLQIAPSATILNWCQQRQTSKEEPLFVGIPGDSTLPNYLPGVLQEIRQLNNIFPNATVLQGEHVSLDNLFVQMKNRSLIHLAGHIFYNAQDPLQSGIPLADGRWLRASDLYLKYENFDGSVITLSGCSSGRGRVMGSDVLGLTSAFLYAGATAVVTGLWQVDDAATSLLMNSFYLQLRRGTSVAEALQCAQIDLLKKPAYNHPYYWSPFQLNGDNPTITV